MKKAKVTCIECLPDEIVEQVLLRLPMLSLRVAKRVCNRWKQVIEHTSFPQVYQGTCEGVTSDHEDDCRKLKSRLDDGCNEPVTFHGAMAHCGKGQILIYQPPFKLYFGNLLTNKWREIPLPVYKLLTDFVISNVRVFALGGDCYRLVYWPCFQPRAGIFTFEQEQWDFVANPEPGSAQGSEFTAPLVLNNTTVVRFDCGAMKLMEYSINGSFSSRPLRADIKLEASSRLVEWQCKLYILTLAEVLENGRELCELQVRAVSADRYSAVLVNTCKIETVLLIDFLQIVVDKNILRCYATGIEDNECYEGTYEIQYDMEKKTLVGDARLIISAQKIHNQWRFN